MNGRPYLVDWDRDYLCSGVTNDARTNSIARTNVNDGQRTVFILAIMSMVKYVWQAMCMPHQGGRLVMSLPGIFHSTINVKDLTRYSSLFIIMINNFTSLNPQTKLCGSVSPSRYLLFNSTLTQREGCKMIDVRRRLRQMLTLSSTFNRSWGCVNDMYRPIWQKQPDSRNFTFELRGMKLNRGAVIWRVWRQVRSINS